MLCSNNKQRIALLWFHNTRRVQFPLNDIIGATKLFGRLEFFSTPLSCFVVRPNQAAAQIVKNSGKNRQVSIAMIMMLFVSVRCPHKGQITVHPLKDWQVIATMGYDIPEFSRKQIFKGGLRVGRKVGKSSMLPHGNQKRFKLRFVINKPAIDVAKRMMFLVAKVTLTSVHPVMYQVYISVQKYAKCRYLQNALGNAWIFALIAIFKSHIGQSPCNSVGNPFGAIFSNSFPYRPLDQGL
mmetsp:Transcript_31967/g.66720  ORF Transcript_31967/g.66720 Transcript_31967/m.66720 type:complete len:239 (-) Transcript_31967:485-1201(-)